MPNVYFSAKIHNYSRPSREDEKGSVLSLSVKLNTHGIPPNYAPHEKVYVPPTEENKEFLDCICGAIGSGRNVTFNGRYDYISLTIWDIFAVKLEKLVSHGRAAPIDRRYQGIVEIDEERAYGIRYRTHKEDQTFKITHIF